MKVLFIAGWCDPFGDFTKEHAYAVAKHCSVTYVYLEFIKSWDHLPYKIRQSKESHYGVEHYFIKIYCPLRRFNVYQYLIKKAFTSTITSLQSSGKFDICHINVRTPVTELVPELRIIKNIPIVVTEQSSFYGYGIYTKFQGETLVKEKQRISSWFKNDRFKYILPISDHLGNVLSEHYSVSPTLISRIPNIAANEFIYAPKVKKDKINIMLVAHWSAPKNPMLFVRALTLLPVDIQHQLTINWIGEGDQMKEVKAYTAEHLANVDISFLGYVRTRVEMAQQYQLADLFVHPTDMETLSCVIIESLCCGTPVLSIRVGGIVELIDGNNGKLSELNNPNVFANNLLEMLKNLSKYNNQLIANNAKALFSAEAVGAKTYSIYKSAKSSI
jgi:glycosyltransferase involved in cell wall biosynthesis